MFPISAVESLPKPPNPTAAVAVIAGITGFAVPFWSGRGAALAGAEERGIVVNRNWEDLYDRLV